MLRNQTAPLVHMYAEAALGRVPWVPVNPWISRTYAKEPLKLEIESDSRIVVNLWIETPNVGPAMVTMSATNRRQRRGGGKQPHHLYLIGCYSSHFFKLSNQ